MSQIAKKKFPIAILLGGLSVNLNHQKRTVCLFTELLLVPVSVVTILACFKAWQKYRKVHKLLNPLYKQCFKTPGAIKKSKVLFI